MTVYNPIAFWEEEGKKPVGRSETRFKEHALILPSYLENMNFHTVLEIGPGDGRITELILDQKSVHNYTVVEMSKDRIEMLKKNIKEPIVIINEQIQDAKIDLKYDLVISVECLLHIPPQDIEKVLTKMVSLSNKYIINIDYQPLQDEGTLAFYNFIHPYEEIYNKLGVKLKKRRIGNEVMYIAEK